MFIAKVLYSKGIAYNVVWVIARVLYSKSDIGCSVE